MLTTAPQPAPQLHVRLAALEARVAAAVAARQAVDPDPDDAFRGLYISDGQASALAAGRWPPPAPPSPPARTDDVSGDGRLDGLAARFGLDAKDLDVLVAALAPDLDPRFERLYGYLQDDVSRRRASAGLALELAGLAWTDVCARRRLLPGGALVEGGLVTVDDADRPFLTRALRVPDRVTSHLLGDDRPEPWVAAHLAPIALLPDIDAGALATAMRAGAPAVYLREGGGAVGRQHAAAAFGVMGFGALALDVAGVVDPADLPGLVAGALREARLQNAGLVLGPLQDVARGPDPAAVLQPLVTSVWPVVVVGNCPWDPHWTPVVPLIADAPVLDATVRANLWAKGLSGADALAADVAHLRLVPEQIAAASRAARLHATYRSRDVEAGDVRHGARTQNAAGLARLATHIEPRCSFRDLVLPPDVLDHLHELVARARHRDLVLDGWKLQHGSSRGRGILALFAGESGTGKTMAAEVVAAGLGLDLYTVDLATVVDKYVGETEKNLDRIFAEAEGVNAVLFFDEADALFGKRSEVRDAKDRWANVETAYLLQRMERFDGIAVLATNLRGNLDDAFTRRLDVVALFPLPDVLARRTLWDRCLGEHVPRADDVDLDALAGAHELSGGNIRNVTLAAAYRAAAAGRRVTMDDLNRSTQAEYRKMGRLGSP